MIKEEINALLSDISSKIKEKLTPECVVAIYLDLPNVDSVFFISSQDRISKLKALHSIHTIIDSTIEAIATEAIKNE